MRMESTYGGKNVLSSLVTSVHHACVCVRVYVRLASRVSVHGHVCAADTPQIINGALVELEPFQ